MHASDSDMATTAELSRPGRSSNKSEIPCRFFARGVCRHGDECWFKHEVPPTALQAGAPAFVPSVARPAPSVSDAVMASPVAFTSDLPAPATEDDVGTCNICFEPPFRFGLLEACNHIFCLKCIMDWRTEKGKTIDQIEGDVLKRCPACRAMSNYVTPSDTWIPHGSPAKAGFIASYKARLARIPCRNFEQSMRADPTAPFCPFGSDCFYAHLNPDGTPHSFNHGIADHVRAGRQRREQRLLERRLREYYGLGAGERPFHYWPGDDDDDDFDEDEDDEDGYSDDWDDEEEDEWDDEDEDDDDEMEVEAARQRWAAAFGSRLPPTTLPQPEEGGAPIPLPEEDNLDGFGREDFEYHEMLAEAIARSLADTEPGAGTARSRSPPPSLRPPGRSAAAAPAPTTGSSGATTGRSPPPYQHAIPVGLRPEDELAHIRAQLQRIATDNARRVQRIQAEQQASAAALGLTRNAAYVRHDTRVAPHAETQAIRARHSDIAYEPPNPPGVRSAWLDDDVAQEGQAYVANASESALRGGSRRGTRRRGGR